MFSNKPSPNKFKKTDIIPSIFSDQNGMELEINNRKKTEKVTNVWKLNNTFMNNQWVRN